MSLISLQLTKRLISYIVYIFMKMD